VLRPRLLVLALALAGCAHAYGRTDPPAPVARAYGAALAEGDAAQSHALETAGAHRGRSVEAQRARIEDARAELADVGRRIAEGPITSRARIPLANGETVVLAWSADGTWRIEGGLAGAPALAAPTDAIAALRSALVRRDLPGIEETLARETRAAWEDEVTRVIDALEDPDALGIDVRGDRATVTTPDGSVVELAREADAWRVVDVRPGPAP
jgi:hypothetical protein